MDLRLEQRPRQMMTTALRQALHILQLPQLDLARLIQAEMESNPLLECDQEGASLRAGGSIDVQIPVKPTLREHLLRQAREQFEQKMEFRLACDLIDQIDEKGYLAAPLSSEQEAIVPILQGFDPPGLFARNLQESFLLQLQRKHGSSLLQTLVREFFPDLLRGRFSVIRKKMQISSKELEEALQTLSHLSPRPGSFYQDSTPQFLVADLAIFDRDEKYLLEVCEKELPRMTIRSDYLRKLSCANSEEKETVRSWVKRIQDLQRACLRRRDLLEKIGRILIRSQGSYFAQEGELCPIDLNTLAQELKVHVSTAWRAVANKMISCPRGIKPLSLFFSDSARKSSIKERLVRLIQQEDQTSPLTDAELTNKLREQGISCARRTVSYMRRSLKFRSSVRRKQHVTFVNRQL